MSGPINRLALGLLGLFDVRGAGGTYPTTLADFVQPTIELARFMRAQELELVSTGSVPLSINGHFPLLAVPATERWFVHEFTVGLVDLGADQAIEFAAMYSQGGNLNVFHRLDEYQLADGATMGTNPALLSSARYGMPRVVGPGKILGVSIKRITVGAEGNVDMRLDAAITRLTA